MRRRTLLAGVGTALAGCLGDGRPSSSTTTGTCSGPVVTTTPHRTPVEDAEFALELADGAVAADGPLEFDARVSDRHVAPSDPGGLTLGLRNTTTTTVTVHGGSVAPFEMVWARKSDGGEFLLWRPYTTEGCYQKHDGEWLVCDVAKTIALEPCERLQRTYEVLPTTTDTYPEDTAPPGPGDYRLSGEVRTDEDGTDASLSYDVEFSLERS